MDTKYIPPFVTLLAAAISCICSIVKQMDVTKALFRLLIVIIIFYIIGRIAQKMILMVMGMAVKDIKKESGEESTEGEEASMDSYDPDADGSSDESVKSDENGEGRTEPDT